MCIRFWCLSPLQKYPANARAGPLTRLQRGGGVIYPELVATQCCEVFGSFAGCISLLKAIADNVGLVCIFDSVEPM